MRPINADSAIWQLRRLAEIACNKGDLTRCQIYKDLMEMLDKMPSVNLRDRYGKWIHGECSECGSSIAICSKLNGLEEEDQHFCYNCGAIMHKELVEFNEREQKINHQEKH